MDRAVDALRQGRVGEVGSIQVASLVGVGHSTGAGILIHQQAATGMYDALALLGWAGRGMPEALSESERLLTQGPLDDAALVASARDRYDEPLPVLPGNGTARMLVASEVSPEVRRVMARAKTRLLAVAGHASMLPGSAREAAQKVDVPVFLGVGERDIALEHHRIPADFPASGDVSLFVLPGAGHNQNIEPGRARLWARILGWAVAVTS